MVKIGRLTPYGARSGLLTLFYARHVASDFSELFPCILRDTTLIPWGVKSLPTGLIIAGFLTATAAVNTSQFSFVRFSGTRWGFDQFYARSLMNIVLDWGRITWAVGDKGLLNIRNLKVTK